MFVSLTHVRLLVPPLTALFLSPAPRHYATWYAGQLVSHALQTTLRLFSSVTARLPYLFSAEPKKREQVHDNAGYGEGYGEGVALLGSSSSMPEQPYFGDLIQTFFWDLVRPLGSQKESSYQII